MAKVLLKNGIKIHYQQIGQGPDLVMLHGLYGNLAVWHLQIAPLLWDHSRMLTYDLRGHGYSDAPLTGYTPDDMADDLGELLDVLEIDQPVLVGHSFGADIALYFAMRHPERIRQVIAIEATLPAMSHLRGGEDWKGWVDWSEKLERYGYPVPADRRSDFDYLVRRTSEVPRVWGPLKGIFPDAKSFLRFLDESTIAEDVHRIGTLTLDRIAGIRVPVLLMYAANSVLLGAHDYLLTHLPDVNSVLLPESDWAHFAPLEQPELVAEHILANLKPAMPLSVIGD